MASIRSRIGVVMKEEIELIKRSKVERLAIANTLLDSVAMDTDLNLVSKILNDCMEKVTDCIVILDKTGE